MNNTIKQNISIHNEIYHLYNLKHVEIYNDVEQNRLNKLVERIVSNISSKKIKVLDVGAGTGNLSLKFLKNDCEVVASDVSKKSLELLKKLSNNNCNLKLSLIKNRELPLNDNQFDVVCTYSVLHHIPDYLFTVKEMIRVCKPGGFIYIDHEANKNRYYPGECLSEYNRINKQTKLEHIRKLFRTRELFSLSFIKAVFIIFFINKKYRREGDIHVWKDDYIDWDKIKEVFKKNNCEVLKEIDYLMYKPKGGIEIFDKYKKKCSDTKYVIFKKKP
jgi:ubiquinone/menaquinone biosynthesis C-methylase UbiE